MLKRNYLIVLYLLFTILAIGYWAYNGSLTSGTISRVKPPRQSADYFMEQAKIVKYGAQGTPVYQLSSDSISHYPHNDTTLLSHPHMTSYQKPGQITEADALNGKLLSNNNTLILWDTVVMTQHTVATGKIVRLDTEYLTILSGKGIAETDRPILITSDNIVIQAIGMQTFYDKGLINLKSRVRGTHEPN